MSFTRLVVSIQYRLVTDGQTDGRTDGHTMTAYTALAQRRAVKTVPHITAVLNVHRQRQSVDSVRTSNAQRLP